MIRSFLVPIVLVALCVSYPALAQNTPERLPTYGEVRADAAGICMRQTGSPVCELIFEYKPELGECYLTETRPREINEGYQVRVVVPEGIQQYRCD